MHYLYHVLSVISFSEGKEDLRRKNRTAKRTELLGQRFKVLHYYGLRFPFSF